MRGRVPSQSIGFWGREDLGHRSSEKWIVSEIDLAFLEGRERLQSFPNGTLKSSFCGA